MTAMQQPLKDMGSCRVGLKLGKDFENFGLLPFWSQIGYALNFDPDLICADPIKHYDDATKQQ